MIPDVTIKNYYLQFIYSANTDINSYNKILENILKVKEAAYHYITKFKKNIIENYNINIEDTIEYKTKKYNSKESLYNTIKPLLNNFTNRFDKVCILQIAKYCNMLKEENKYLKLIKLASNRKNIKFNEYRKYITIYYNEVHKCVLSGMGYKFSNGIGTYIINHWKIPIELKRKNHIDFAASNARKKQLIKEGKRIYDEKEALWYKARNIPYDGVEYRIYKDSSDWYEFTFINSSIVKKSLLEYKRTEYVANKYRGMSYKEMADKLCKTENDIYNLQVDIKYKLNILLYKDPTKYLNFVRNAEQCKYKYRKNNCKNR